MKSKVFKATAIASLLMLMTINVHAQERRGPESGRQGHERMEQRGHEKPRGPHIPGMTEEQKEQMKSLHLELEKAVLPVRNQIGEKEARLRTLVTAENYDEKAVNRTLDEIGDLKTQVRKLEVANLQKAKEFLTEEQMLFLYKNMDKGPGQKRDPKDGPRGRKRGR